MRIAIAVAQRQNQWAVLALVIASLGIFALAFDQGQLLAPVLGEASYQLNILHELVHDARHAAGFPCH